jgi:hypothetical protein
MKKQKTLQDRFAVIQSNSFWLVLVSLITTLLCVPFFRTISLGDEGMFLRAAELMLGGKRLYADFFEFIPPGSFILTAAWFGMAGVSIGAARTLTVLTIVGIACFTFLVCRRTSRNAPLSAILVTGWVMMSQWQWMQVSHHWFTTFFSMVAAWAALAGLDQPPPRSLRWPLIAGLAAGAAIMVMQTCGAWVALAAMTAFFNLRQNRAELVVYVSGILLVSASVIAFLIEQHALVAAFDDVVVYAATQYASIQYVPFGSYASIFDWPLKFVFPITALLLLLVIARNWRAGLHDRQLWLCTAFALAGFLGCFPRPDIVHIGFTVPLALPLLALCGARLTLLLRPTYRHAIATAIILGLIPSAIAFASVARTALNARIVSTPRGNVAIPFNDGTSELIQNLAATPSQATFFFYPYMPMTPFLVAREHVSKYDIFVPGYTTPAQYQEACLSAVQRASRVVIDRRFSDYDYWKKGYPSMPKAEPMESSRFQKILDSAFTQATRIGDYEIRRRREGISDNICDGIVTPRSD